MKNNITSAILALMFAASLAAAQTGGWHNVENLPCDQTKTVESSRPDREPANPPATADRIAAARAPYTQPEGPSANALAQFPSRRPGPPFSRGAGYPGPAYPQMWNARPSGRHALIGAVIGGLLGAAIGAKGNAGARTTFAFGALGAGLGAAIGLTIPSYPGPQMYRRTGRDDREESSSSNAVFRPDASFTEAINRKSNKRFIEQRNPQCTRLHQIDMLICRMVTDGNDPGPGQSKVVIYCVYSAP